MKFSAINDPDYRKDRIEYITRRWVGNFDQYRESVSEAAKYLMAVNSGGALATLGFMGAMKTIYPISGAPAMLVFFLVGILLVGLGRIVGTYRLLGIATSWKDSIEENYQDLITWQDVLHREAESFKRSYVVDIFAWGAFSCFVAALAIGGVGLFGS